MNKKLIATLLSAAMCLSLAACGQKTDAPAGSGSGSGAVSASNGEKTQYTVGICQLVQHVALDAATQGFIDALNEALPGQVTIENKNASGEPNNCATIVNGFVSEGVDLIMANATAALQAAFNGTETIPVLGTSITDYASAQTSDTALYTRYFKHMLDRGIYLAPSQFEAMFLSAAHSTEDLDATLAAAKEFAL